MPPLVGHCQDIRGLNRSGKDPLFAVPDGLFHFEWRIGVRLPGACRTKQKLLQGLSSELQIRLLQRLWLGAEYPREDQVVGVRGHQDVVAVRCQPHDPCPRPRVKDHRIRVGDLVLFDPLSDCTGANPRSCKINWSAVGAPRKPHHHDPLEPGA